MKSGSSRTGRGQGGRDLAIRLRFDPLDWGSGVVCSFWQCEGLYGMVIDIHILIYHGLIGRGGLCEPHQ